MLVAVSIISALLVILEAAPSDVSIAGSAEIAGTPRPKLISIENGTIYVNLLGFKASAGLGGLITGNMYHGGPHAEVETPFGQKAGAGIGGSQDDQGSIKSHKLYSFADDGVSNLSKIFVH